MQQVVPVGVQKLTKIETVYQIFQNFQPRHRVRSVAQVVPNYILMRWLVDYQKTHLLTPRRHLFDTRQHQISKQALIFAPSPFGASI